MIVDWQTPELARHALASLHKSKIDYTARVFDAHAMKLSYSQAIHLGVKQGSAPIVCALNADVECKGSQRPVLDLFEDPEVAVVGPLQVDARGFIRHGGIFGTNEAPLHRGFGDPISKWDPPRAPLRRTEDAITVSGSVYYARRSVWDELGGFLDTPHYFEETWFSYLVRHRGHRVLYTGEVEWLHHWNSAPASDREKGEWFAESQAIFRAACAAEGIACD